KRRSDVDPPVQVRTDAGDELAGERFLRLLAALLTESKVLLDGIAECLLQLGDACALEGDDIPSVDDFTVEDLHFVVEFNVACIALVFLQSVPPASYRKRRMERAAP